MTLLNASFLLDRGLVANHRPLLHVHVGHAWVYTRNPINEPRPVSMETKCGSEEDGDHHRDRELFQATF